MSKHEFKTESGYSIIIEAENKEKASEIFEELFKEIKVLI